MQDSSGLTPTSRQRIVDAVFSLMGEVELARISVGAVVARANVSRSTFYRLFPNVDAVVEEFETELLETIRTINELALKTPFGTSQLGPTASMVSRMETLLANREKILALTGPRGDPTFSDRATAFMRGYFKLRLRGVYEGDPALLDLYLSFIIAGHNELIDSWLRRHPSMEPRAIAALLGRLNNAVLFLDEASLSARPHFISAP